MQFIKPDINIDFLGKKKIAFIFSAVMILVSVASLLYHGGPKFGIDFAGGTVVQIKFDSPVSISDIKDGLRSMGLEGVTVQTFGEKDDHEYLIRIDRAVTTSEAFSGEIQKALKSSISQEADIRRVEMVGPQVGKDLREKALFAIFYSLLFIAIYISGRFELKWLLSGVMAGVLIGAVYLLDLIEVSIPVLIVAAMIVTLVLFWVLNLKYAMGAIVALVHDVMITVGLFSLFDKEFSLPIIAAILTIIGYSLNDTIIIFDRIRENLRKYRKHTLEFIINRSVNETLSRTILTALTTLIVVLALFLFGGGIIHDFAFALLVGVIVGTYSSIYIASPFLLTFQVGPKKR
ncbi:MAG: protein translocase subunit SecF [Deltaproteobacteria bacterium]|nr:protein translocase subunit SecF [Deltaproteobacteria bacterium]MBW2042425.1 protein translocase subunit SecF [Deltaproteobacteria bacterium]MBW2131068.1 protein translocase subunit SecF [Deltaproteobacteria bacterium]